MDEATTHDEPDGTFSVGRDAWLARLGNLRNFVRQELITSQLTAHLPPPPARILDVGAGQGTQAIRLATLGYSVTAVEPDPTMRAMFAEATDRCPADVATRLDLRTGRIGELDRVLDAGPGYAAVLCHGVLMYLPAAGPAVAELASFVAPGGVLAIAARSAAFLPWRPLLRHDWDGARRAFAELDQARVQSRDPRYLNEIGSPARADTVEELTALCEAAGLRRESWYGVRVASDDSDVSAPVPTDHAETALMLELEERLGRTDPYRQLAALFHLIARRPGLDEPAPPLRADQDRRRSV